jgi:hypothetical protein
MKNPIEVTIEMTLRKTFTVDYTESTVKDSIKANNFTVDEILRQSDLPDAEGWILAKTKYTY